MQDISNKMRLLKLQEGIIYGPVKSRRLGRSLGINLLPTGYKLCTFNCLYCHYGWTKAHTDCVAEPVLGDLPSVEEVEKALREWLKTNQIPIDYITFSGNGEPTLHPEFHRMVEATLRVRDRYVPGVRVAVLSNSTCLDKKRVMEGLRKLDKRIMKLDCGTEEGFRKLNRPSPHIKFEKVVEKLREMDEVIIQTVLVRGRMDNTGEREIGGWIEKLRYIKPAEVQIYSIDRPSADESLTPVGKERLNQIAKRAQEESGVQVNVF